MNFRFNDNIFKKKSDKKVIFKIFIALIIGSIAISTIYLIANNSDMYMEIRYVVSDVINKKMQNVVIKVSGVSLDKNNIVLNLNSTLTLAVTFTPTNVTNKAVTWSSSNKKIATVDKNGKVKGIKEGKVTITVKTKDGGKTAKCMITVKKLPKVKEVLLDQKVIALYVNDTYKLIPTINPTDAGDKAVTWSSSNAKVATVDKNGKVMGIKAGIATITVKTKDGGKTAKCTVTVKNIVLTIPLSIQNFRVEKYNDNMTVKEEKSGYDDNSSISINNTNYNDAKLIYVANGLEPNEVYQFEAYIKGEKIVNENGDQIGAVICSDNWDTSATGNLGTFDWRKIRYVGKANDNGVFELQLRLGFDYNFVKGKVYFDNLTMTKYDGRQYTGSNIRLGIDSEDLMNNGRYYIDDNKINTYVKNLDKVYQAYYDLTGVKPFNGKLIDIFFNNYHSFYAFAGNPIQVNKTYSKEMFTNLNNNNWDMGFGIIHEISHNFDNEKWDFEAEFWANTKMMYALDKYKFSVNVNGSGKLTGNKIINYYKKAYDQNLKNGIISYDGVTYLFAKIKEKYGWDIFKKTFRYFNNLPDTLETKKDMFILFIQKLSDYSRKDIKKEFFNNTVWNTIIGDLNMNGPNAKAKSNTYNN